MITVTTSFLGLDVSALCYRDNAGRWFIDDLKVSNGFHDMFDHLKPETLQNLESHVKTEAEYTLHKFL